VGTTQHNRQQTNLAAVCAASAAAAQELPRATLPRAQSNGLRGTSPICWDACKDVRRLSLYRTRKLVGCTCV
jgi:hypothetical protein